MNKTEIVVLVLILVVALAGVWFLFKGPGMATLSVQPRAYQPVIRSEGYTEQVGDVLIKVQPPTNAPVSNLCVCKNKATGQVQSRPAGAGESIYSCRSSCVSQGLEFVALQQPSAPAIITTIPTSAGGPGVAGGAGGSALTGGQKVGTEGQQTWTCVCGNQKIVEGCYGTDAKSVAEAAKWCDGVCGNINPHGSRPGDKAGNYKAC